MGFTDLKAELDVPNGFESVEDDDVDGLAAGIGVDIIVMLFSKLISLSVSSYAISFPKNDSSESILGKKFISGASSANVTECLELDWRVSETRIEFFFSTATNVSLSKETV